MNDTYDYSRNFIDEEEFVDCIGRGCELCFDYGGKSYALLPSNERFFFGEAHNEKSDTWYDTAEAILDHPIGDKRLRDILQDMIVTDRSFYPMD